MDQSLSNETDQTARRKTGPGGTAIKDVIDKGFCVGCGLCSAVSPAFEIGETPEGYIKVLRRPSDEDTLRRASSVCPFGSSPDEDDLGAICFDEAPQHHEALGRYVELFAGFSHRHRSSAASGGVTRWLLGRLLDLGEIQFVVTVDRKMPGAEGDLFDVGIHRDAPSLFGEVSASAYFPISLNEALAKITAMEGRFAITALPCFARGLRAYALENPAVGERMAYVSGTICGGLKGRRYADYLAFQMGVPRSDLGRINFRGKTLSRTANEKCVEVWRRGNATDTPDAVARVQQLRGTDYGAGYFKPKACDYCDDVFAETADISFGDAWISPYKESPHGTNVIVVRNARLLKLLREGEANGELSLDVINADQAASTQTSGLRHRRQGLAVRLWVDRLVGAWAPKKRVAPGLGTPAFVASQLVRVAIRAATSLRGLPPTTRAFRLILSALVRAHGALRPRAVAPQPAALGAIISERGGASGLEHPSK